MSTKKHTGSCHCGAVKFEVEVDATKATRCNCSICTKLAICGSNVKPDAFTLRQGEDALTGYVWGHKVSTRYFCKHCGVSCFARGNLPELGGEFVSISFNALDDIDPAFVDLMYWDGRHDNWHAGPRATPWPIAAA